VSRAGVRVIHSNYHQLFSSSSSSSFLLFFFVHVHQLLRLLLLLFSFLYSSSLSIRVVHSLTHSHMIVKTKCDHHFPLPLCLSLVSLLLAAVHSCRPCAFFSIHRDRRDSSIFFLYRVVILFLFAFPADSSLSQVCVLLFLYSFLFCFLIRLQGVLYSLYIIPLSNGIIHSAGERDESRSAGMILGDSRGRMASIIHRPSSRIFHSIYLL
jgi:hypothetical protein